ncbi:MAG: rod shape-determining protein [Clostridia bacterium]|nr:rod shape-determining protein [Clostridia bacterium]
MGLKLLKSKDMGIDLGTANTLIFIKDEGIVLNEPSVIAENNISGEIIAVGHQAKAMLGKAPNNITVVKPLQDGVISDFDKTGEMLRVLISRACEGKKFANFKVAIGVPSGVTEVEKRAVEETVREMGAEEVFILEEPFAAAIGAGLPIDSDEGCMIVDIGGGTTDIAVIALGGIVASTSIRYAGDKFNEAVISYVRRTYNLLIGDKTAEQLKSEIGCAALDLDENGNEIIKTMQARGRDVLSGLPKVVEISNKDLMLALSESVDVIVDGVRATIEKTPPEIAADIAINGLVLAGGGGLLYNLDKLICERTGIKVSTAANAFEAVAEGTGTSLDDLNKLKHYVMSKKRIEY